MRYSQQPCRETCPCVFLAKITCSFGLFCWNSTVNWHSKFMLGLPLVSSLHYWKTILYVGMHQYCTKAVPFDAQLISDLSPTVNFSFCLHCPGNWELHFVIAFTSHGFIRSEKILSGLKLQPSHQFRIYRMHFSCIMIIQVIYKSKEN